MTITEQIEFAYREGYRAGYEEGQNTAAEDEWGWNTDELVRKKNQDTEWESSESREKFCIEL